jgi:hypothetical protein
LRGRHLLEQVGDVVVGRQAHFPVQVVDELHRSLVIATSAMAFDDAGQASSSAAGDPRRLPGH